MSDKVLVDEARKCAPGDEATGLAVMVHRLADALEAATRERDAEPDAATEIERYRDAAEGNRIRLVHAQNDAEQFEAERDAALAAAANARGVLDLLSNYADESNGAAYGTLSAQFVKAHVVTALAALDGAPEPEWEYRARTDYGRVVAQGSLDEIGSLSGHIWERRRKAGPWLPVPGGEGESENE